MRACQEEWRANRAANEAAGITQKAYVEKCRTGATTAQPAPVAGTAGLKDLLRAPTAQQPRRPRRLRHHRQRERRLQARLQAQGNLQPRSEAKARCPRDTVVWVNLDSRIYHFAGYKAYGTTKTGAYMCERDTSAAGFRAAKSEKHP